MLEKVYMLIVSLLATAGVLCTASCDSVVWGADIRSYVDAGLSNVFIRAFSTDRATTTKSVPSREEVTVTVSIVNPESLGLQASLDCPGAPQDLSFAQPQWLGGDYETLSFTFTAPEGTERTTLPFALSFYAPATAKDYPNLPVPVRVDSPPEAPATAIASFDQGSESFVAFLLPEGYRNEDIVAVQVTATGETAGTSPKTARLTDLEYGNWIRWSPPGADANDGYTYSFVCIDVVGLESPVSADFIQDTRYLVFYNANGGTGLVMDPAGYDVGVDVTLLPATTLNREGYAFAAWNSAEDGSRESHAPGDPVPMVIGGLEFWAQWTPVEYTVHLELAGGLLPPGSGNPFTYTIESDAIALPQPTRPGYSFGGWYDNVDLTGPAVTEIPTGSTGDKTFYAQWETSPYTITWNLNDSDLFPATNNPGNPVSFDVTDSFAFAAPTRPGYTFGGWFENADFTGTALTALPAGTTQNLELNAKWTALSYTITWNLNDSSDFPASNASTNPASYTSGQTPAFAAPTRPGYTFGGWFENADFTGTALTALPVGSYGEKAYYAKWTIIAYSVTYTLNDGSLPAGTENPFTYTIEDDVITLPQPTRLGYTFGGWFDNASGTGTAIVEIPAGSTGDKTFYAQWETSPYTITWNLNDSDLFPATNNPGNPVSFDVTDSFAFMAPTRPGFTFDGWFDNADFTGTARTALPAGSTGDKTFYAKWTQLAGVTFTLDVGNAGLVFSTSTVIVQPNTPLSIACTNTAVAASGSNWVWRLDGAVQTDQYSSSFTWIPHVNDIGQHVISCEVTYQGLVYSGSVTLTVDY